MGVTKADLRFRVKVRLSKRAAAPYVGGPMCVQASAAALLTLSTPFPFPHPIHAHDTPQKLNAHYRKASVRKQFGKHGWFFGTFYHSYRIPTIVRLIH